MVMVAEKVRQRLLPGSSSQSSCGDDEEMDSKEETKDWLMSVGIISPVTKESAGAMYHQQQLSCQVKSVSLTLYLFLMANCLIREI
jgi:ESCRT-II complex subunit VPS36